MIIDAGQVNAILANLEVVKEEQMSIINELEDVIFVNLAAAWECEAQKKYSEVFVSLRDENLSQINTMIELFNTLLLQVDSGFTEVDLELVSAIS